jgi:two-component sensor histidine kinase
MLAQERHMSKFAIRLLTPATYVAALVVVPAVTPAKATTSSSKHIKHKNIGVLASAIPGLSVKDLMSRESDHRLMNGLQMVSSLLSLQSREARNAKAAEQLKIAANRVATIGSVHKRLHALDHVRSVELKQYLENLCQDMRGILPAEGGKHNLAVEGIALEVPTAIGRPLGYIVSELVTNFVKYANGKITVRLGMNPGKGYALSVSDDGPGFPKPFDPKKSKGLGMKIVSSLVNQIGGQSLFGPNHLGRGAGFTVPFTPNERTAEPTGMRTCTKMARERYIARSIQHWHIVKIDADGKETVVGITDSERDAKAEAARLQREAEHTVQTQRNT